MQTEGLHPRQIDKQVIEKLKAELGELDRDAVIIDGIHLKPSQCYHFDIDPVHVLFNTNCPDSLKEKVQAILLKYENSAQ
jgi:hypothetical protein